MRELSEEDRARLKARQALIVRKARECPIEFTRWVGRIEGSYAINVAETHREWHNILTEHPNVVLFAPTAHGKRLPVDTPVATPSGWRAIGSLAPGDTVLSGNGKPTKVTWVSDPELAEEAYELTFSDGAKITADAEHQWLAWSVNDRASRRAPQTVTTSTIVQNFTRACGRKRWSIPVAEPARYPTQALPVHPYVLGAWLGDGRANRGMLFFHKNDTETFSRCLRLEKAKGGVRREVRGTYYQTILGLRTKLRKLGVLDNKHIPSNYLRASEHQRRELLAGLMDTDGHVSIVDNRLEFCTVNATLAQNVLELARSLGWVVSLRESTAKLYGKDCGSRYRICWTSWRPVFRLARKADRHKAGCAARKHRKGSSFSCPPARKIVGWRKVAPTQMRCIAVDAEPHTYIATRGYVVTHNSNQISRWRVLWEIGKNPDIRVALISSSMELPQKIINGIRQDINGVGPGSHWLRLIFPHLARHRWRVWSDTKLSLDLQAHPTISIYSPKSKILGSRIDLCVVDDLHNIQNTLTPESRASLHKWLTGEVFSRRPATGMRVWMLGHVWHEDDVLHRLVKQGFYTKKYSCFTENEEGVQVPLIPEIWTMERLQSDIAMMGPIMSKLMMLNELTDSQSSRIKREYFEQGLKRGRTYGAKFHTTWNPSDAPTITGVDLGFGGGSLTVLFTVAVLPDGSRLILDIRSGDWTGPEKLDQLREVYQAYGSIICVESNGAQVMLNEFAQEFTALPIKEHSTGLNKHDLKHGTESIATELCNNKWIIPCDEDMRTNSEIAAWINEAVAYTPNEHPGDRHMAGWICREGIRKTGLDTRNLAEFSASFFDIEDLVI